MAAARITTVWTVFVNAFLRVLAVLGPGRAARPAVPAAPVPTSPAGLIPVQAKAATPRPRSRGRSLPPTIKQRIHAEAHGSSPSVRRVCLALGDPDGEPAGDPRSPAPPGR